MTGLAARYQRVKEGGRDYLARLKVNPAGEIVPRAHLPGPSGIGAAVVRL